MYIDEDGDIIEESLEEILRMQAELDKQQSFVFKGCRANVENYKNIAKAIEMSGNNRSNLVGIMDAYQQITGVSINKSTLRCKLRYLNGVLAR
jgi:hypothetical protein